MGRPYSDVSPELHRHGLRTSGNCIRLFPFVPAGPPDLDMKSTAHKLCALGHFNDDVEVI